MNMKRLSILFLGTVLLLMATASVATAKQQTHAMVRFHQVGNSGVSGFVLLRQLPKGGTHINVVAFGLKPSNAYVSLYYSNHVCDLEPYEASDVIGGIYTANRVGVGVTEGNADDDLDEINSVSVRRASDFTLLACANVHP
jgi:hypothetical protein